MEKDATVDYLRPVIDFAATTGAYVIFRNQVPALSLVEHIRPDGRRPSDRQPGRRWRSPVPSVRRSSLFGAFAV